MSIQTQITRIQTARNKIRAKLVQMGLATSVDTLDTLATAVDGIVDRGAISATVQEGDTYTIPAGFHNGSGTVSGISGGGSYNLQSKKVTPTKNQLSVTPDSGYYGLSDVTVEAIPDTYQDVSSVTASPATVLANQVFVDKTGKTQTGTMKNNGAISGTISGLTTTTFSIPAGYTSGGTVSLTSDIENALAAI